MFYFLVAVGILLFSAIPGALARKGSHFWDGCSLLLSMSGCALGIGATIFILRHPEHGVLNIPWQLVPGAVLAFKVDALSAIFIFPAFLVTAAGSLYGIGYWPIQEKPGSGAWLRFFYPILAGSMILLLASNNAFLFLINWEIMALSGYFLVVTDQENDEVNKAGFIYFAATHTGTMALFGVFAFLMQIAPGDYLPAVGSLDANSGIATAIFLLALFGFGFKAGFIPLHIWLPGAHANAPSNVSALMSGVMIKMGIYGLIRITSFFDTPPLWWGQTILTFGLISAVFGVVFAIAQHDIKRLLAYHSVENIGIILLGFGIALLGRTYHNESMIFLGLAGALLHVINHGLFKGLLFLSAGSLIHKTGTRTLTQYGGLIRKMPYTAFFFLGGAVAICGLPPLNGFVSEWLVYLGIFTNIQGQFPLVDIFVAPGLAMTGGLALLCFTKVFGLSFLGTPRTSLKVSGDSPKSMLFSMAILFSGCVWIGLAPATMIPILQDGVSAWSGIRPNNQLDSLVSAGNISFIALALIITVLVLTFIMKLKAAPQQDSDLPTWGCGYQHKIARVQYTTSSFAQIISDFFHWALRTEHKFKKPTGLFPSNESFYKTHTPDAFLDLMIRPLFRVSEGIAVRIRHFIQNGIIGYYLLYSLLATTILLVYIHFY